MQKHPLWKKVKRIALHVQSIHWEQLGFSEFYSRTLPHADGELNLLIGSTVILKEKKKQMKDIRELWLFYLSKNFFHMRLLEGEAETCPKWQPCTSDPMCSSRHEWRTDMIGGWNVTQLFKIKQISDSGSHVWWKFHQLSLAVWLQAKTPEHLDQQVERFGWFTIQRHQISLSIKTLKTDQWMTCQWPGILLQHKNRQKEKYDQWTEWSDER